MQMTFSRVMQRRQEPDLGQLERRLSALGPLRQTFCRLCFENGPNGRKFFREIPLDRNGRGLFRRSVGARCDHAITDAVAPPVTHKFHVASPVFRLTLSRAHGVGEQQRPFTRQMQRGSADAEGNDLPERRQSRASRQACPGAPAGPCAARGEVGPIVAAREAGEEIAGVRPKAAGLIGAAPKEVALTQTTMSGWSAAVRALPFKGRRILVTPDEWGECAQTFSQLGASRDMRIEVMKTTPEGDLDLAALEASIDDDVAAISAPMVSSLRGRRCPVEKIGSIARPDHSFFVVDGAQALGQLPVDVGRINCDIFAATARKWLRSVRGTALLYVRSSALERMDPVPVLNSSGETVGVKPPDVRRFEHFDFVAALRLALGTAIDVLNARGVGATADAIRTHALHLRERVAQAGIELASPEQPQSGITSFYLPAAATDDRISRHLDTKDIVVKFPPPSDEPMRAAPRDDQVLMRVSPHVYNTASDIDALFDEIASRL